MKRAAARAARLFTCAALIGVAARADYRQVYVDAQRAERDGRLAEAAAGYEAAAREHPQEAARARLVGAIPEPYLPFHRLGVVSFELGRCRQAIDAFERSSRQGVAAKLEPAAAEAEPRLRECRARTGSEAAPLPSAPEDSRRRAEPPASASPSSTEPATVTAAPSPVAEPPEPQSEVAASDAARGGVPAGSTSRQVPAPESTAPSAGLPPSLRAAVEAYFAGSYATAVDLAGRQLPALAGSDDALFIARLIRGAGRYCLYLLDGERDSAALLGATEDLRAARRLRPGFRPQTARFSPRVVALYERIAAEPAGPAAR